jgi:hypothetical protein
VSVLAPDASGLAGVLPLAVIPGEVWIIGYLLIKGMPLSTREVRRSSRSITRIPHDLDARGSEFRSG